MTNAPDFTWLFLRMLAGLAVVSGLAFVLLRYVLPKTGLAGSRKKLPPWVTMLDRVSLDSRRGLFLVKILDRYCVLGASESSVNLIAELTSAEGKKIEG